MLERGGEHRIRAVRELGKLIIADSGAVNVLWPTHPQLRGLSWWAQRLL